MATSPAENALTTLATLKTRLGVSGGSEDDLLNNLIRYASDELERACNRKFYRSDAIEEKAAGYGLPLLQVARTPLLTLTSITFNGATVSADDYEIHDADAGQIRHDGGSWHWTPALLASAGYDPIPGTERKYYTITYNGGWITPNQADATVGIAGTFTGQTRTLPYDLEEACIELCKAAYYSDKRDPRVKSERLLSWSVAYLEPEQWPPIARRAVQRYRRVS